MKICISLLSSKANKSVDKRLNSCHTVSDLRRKTMTKFCAEPTCHTRIDDNEIVCSLHKSLIDLDELMGAIFESEQIVAHEHICPDCGHYFECSDEPCHDFNKSCESCVESDDFDRANEHLSELDGVLSRLA